MAQEDYLKRQIEGVSKMLGKLLFDKSISGEEENIREHDRVGYALSRRDQLSQLIGRGNFNEAENLLFAFLEDDSQSDSGGAKSVELVEWFYLQFSGIDDGLLEQQDFSKEELREGRREALALCQSEA